jgi:Interferon-induced transmembrane protein
VEVLDKLAPTFGPQLLAALVASIGFLWKANRDRRSHEHQYRALLSILQQEMQVLETFIRAYVEGLAPDDGGQQEVVWRARQRLEFAYNEFDEARAAWYEGRHPHPPERVSSHLRLAVVGLLLSFLFGIPAVLFAVLARRSLSRGQVVTAKKQARRALIFSWTGIITGTLFLLLVLFSA